MGTDSKTATPIADIRDRTSLVLSEKLRSSHAFVSALDKAISDVLSKDNIDAMATDFGTCADGTRFMVSTILSDIRMETLYLAGRYI